MSVRVYVRLVGAYRAFTPRLPRYIGIPSFAHLQFQELSYELLLWTPLTGLLLRKLIFP